MAVKAKSPSWFVIVEPGGHHRERTGVEEHARVGERLVRDSSNTRPEICPRAGVGCVA